ncbi:MAG TPA: pyridoxal phosphate-dependent aminotransferase, partial [Cryomorphaceae bacterium]|nr:pyridoxal phosphate-dependent aminotransferase [Cryomorphaceae bacterium]
AKLDEILAIGKKYGIPVVEDAAESLGSTYQGKYTGTFGKTGVYSFNGNKIITTGGGGALVSENGELINRARFLSTQARDIAPHYQHSEIGYNYRLSNVLAGLGRAQMKVLDDRIKARRANFERYRHYFEARNKEGFHIEFQSEPENCHSNRWLSCILVDPEKNEGIDREKIRQVLEKENIESRPLWKPMHLQPVFREYPFAGGNVAESLFNTGLCLPSGSKLTESDFQRIVKALDTCFSNP